VTLWFLLEAGSSSAFVAGALAAARLAHAKIIGYAAVLSLGFLLALLNGWAVDRVGRYSCRTAQSYSVRRQSAPLAPPISDYSFGFAWPSS